MWRTATPETWLATPCPGIARPPPRGSPSAVRSNASPWARRAWWPSKSSVMSGVEIICNGEPRQVGPGATVADLLAELDRPAKQVAVEVNQELVPRARHGEHQLQAGDRIEIYTLVGGG